MNVCLGERTAETVKIYFEKAQQPEIKANLPQKATTLDEALSDFEQTLLPGASSFGRTIYADGHYVGDIWCYCIDLEDEPNCMLSYCVFDAAYLSQGVATKALDLFLDEIRAKFAVNSCGAFTFSGNLASIRVLKKNAFILMEEFEEDGVPSKYFQRAFFE